MRITKFFVISFALFLALVFALLMCLFLVYLPDSKNFVKASCMIDKCTPVTQTCERQECSNIPSGSSSALIQSCTTSFYECYSADIGYQLAAGKYNSAIVYKQVTKLYEYMSDAKHYCNVHKPESSISCYYNRKDVEKTLTLSKSKPMARGTALVAMLSAASFVMLLFGIFMFYKSQV